MADKERLGEGVSQLSTVMARAADGDLGTGVPVDAFDDESLRLLGGSLSHTLESLRSLVGQLAPPMPGVFDIFSQLLAEQEPAAELVDVLTAQLVYDPATRQRLLETREVMRRIERVAAEVVSMAARIATPGQVN